MTQRQFDRAVAAATGESLARTHRLGFVAQAAGPTDPGPADLFLAIDGPFCGRPVPYLTTTAPGAVVDAPADWLPGVSTPQTRGQSPYGGNGPARTRPGVWRAWMADNDLLNPSRPPDGRPQATC